MGTRKDGCFLNSTVLKTLSLLELFTNHPSLSLQQISELAGLPKGSAHRLVTTLQAAGLLQRATNGHYMLGYSFLHYGNLVAERVNIRQLALAPMRTLLEATGEAVSLVLQDGTEAIYVERFESTQPVRTYTRIGRRAPLYAGACPRAILTFRTDQEIHAYLQNAPLTPYASGTITDPTTLWQKILRDRTTGFTVSYSELEDATAGVAAPVFAANGVVAASISLSGPEFRFQQERIPFLAHQTRHAAQQLSKQLGAPTAPSTLV
ncbi:transcriptional regulator (plasmid) [Deinococcus peraridilitoris DSM 19664]|uniref:Transcriptional regulator n=1 Tax=Deinococcus peraridilitoris (strain DSM 19664 / LMG 22246 / CIP 109416 / KR-200) TaxID=937777 RepID=L0A7D4_DEIPD|nr:transcriptional regulator [Deinococcus peraridilitoris DSM 19664]